MGRRRVRPVAAELDDDPVHASPPAFPCGYILADVPLHQIRDVAQRRDRGRVGRHIGRVRKPPHLLRLQHPRADATHVSVPLSASASLVAPPTNAELPSAFRCRSTRYSSGNSTNRGCTQHVVAGNGRSSVVPGARTVCRTKPICPHSGSCSKSCVIVIPGLINAMASASSRRPTSEKLSYGPVRTKTPRADLGQERVQLD